METEKIIPTLFTKLIKLSCICETDIRSTSDGFFAVYKSISDILKTKNINKFIDSNDESFDCSLFFDDWYLYAVLSHNQFIYGLFKLREQEYDAGQGADGDTPGVTISFVEFNTELFLNCLENGTPELTKRLNSEINRVVACRGQKHHSAIKEYFIKSESEGAYVIAELYTEHIASFAKNGFVNVSEHYKEIYKNVGLRKNRRIPDFIEMVNKSAGYTLCDHEKIYIKDHLRLSDYEKNVILAVYSGNVSFHSFGAEVEYHARFLNSFAKIRLPFLSGSVYESAIRADMTIDDKEFEGPTPYYNLASRLVKRHIKYHNY